MKKPHHNWYVVMEANAIRRAHLLASTSKDFKELPRTKDGKYVLVEIHPKGQKAFKGMEWISLYEAAKLVKEPDWEPEESSSIPFPFMLSQLMPSALKLASVTSLALIALTIAGCIVYAGLIR